MKTKAAIVYEFNKPVIVEEIDLRPPRESELMIKIAASGICHSDYSVMTGTIPHDLPEVLGHEGAGTVVEVGPNTEGYQVGDRVMLPFVSSCGKCSRCTSGHPTLCEVHFAGKRGMLIDGTFRFHKGDQDIYQFSRIGALSEYTVVHTNSVVPLPDGYTFEHAALLGCGVTTGVGAVTRTAQVPAGSTVAIIGCGGVGLNVIQGARLAAASTIIAVDQMPSKLDQAKQFGATHCVNSKDRDAVEAVKELTQGNGVQFAFEAIGLPLTIELAYNMLSVGGNAVIIGITGFRDTITIPAAFLPIWEKKITGSFFGSCLPSEDMPYLLSLYKQKKLMLDELISKYYELEEINQAFSDMEVGENIRGMVLFEKEGD
ncbi:MAG: alcohol dehydrogenase [Opitutaceae bacterium]|nr:alcohol dehydrogenase [Opitutaceae bacterium]|tara:strand:- start:432 stop:1547 length:1116 start_codon:yes stop_codon:yes gene_type:complete